MPQADNLYVQQLPPTCTEPEVHAFFSAHGALKSVRLLPTGNRPAAVAFVRFERAEDAATAQRQLDGVPFHPGSPFFLKVQHAQSQEDRAGKQQQQQGGGAGAYPPPAYNAGAAAYSPYGAATAAAADPAAQWGAPPAAPATAADVAAGGSRVQLAALPREMYGLLVGSGGSTHKRIQETHGVKLHIPRSGEEATAWVQGSPDACAAAIQEIEQLTHFSGIAGATPAMQPGLFPNLAQPAGHPAGKGLGAMKGGGMLVPAAAPGPSMPTSPTGGVIAAPPDQFQFSSEFNHPVLGVMRDAWKDRDPQANVYVYGIPDYYDEYGLYLLFAPFGAIASAKVLRKQDEPEKHRGFGFVQFWHAEVAASAIQHMHGLVMGERKLVVRLKEEGGGKGGAAAAGAPDGAGGAPARVEMACPKRRCGQIVGPAASKLKELQASFRVRLTVPRAAEPDGAPVVVEGPEECVSACCAEITRLTAGEATVITE